MKTWNEGFMKTLWIIISRHKRQENQTLWIISYRPTQKTNDAQKTIIIAALLFRSHAEHWIIIYSRIIGASLFRRRIISAALFRRHVIHWIIAAVQNYAELLLYWIITYLTVQKICRIFSTVIFLFFSPIKGL
jgi:hypothetical protein